MNVSRFFLNNRPIFLMILLGIITFTLYQNTGTVNTSQTWNIGHNKKGVGVSLWQERSRDEFSDPMTYHLESAQQVADRVRAFNAAWYYTWDPEPLSMLGTQSGDPMFIPMILRYKPDELHSIHGYPFTISNQIERARLHMPSQRHRFVLLYNEPDNNTPDHPFQHPVETQAATEEAIDQLSSIAQFVGAPAMAIIRDQNRPWYSVLSDDQKKLVKAKTLPWYRLFIENASHRLKQLMFGPNGRPLIPVHVYPDPFLLGAAQSRADLELGSPKRLNAKRAVINHVLRFLMNVRRDFNAQIMITEFNIADWDAKWKPHLVPENRIPEDFVVEVLQELLPEISSLAFVSHYALFTIAKDYGENLKSAASFENFFEIDPITKRKRRIPAAMTAVGQLYANFQDVACQKGEFIDGDKRIEFITVQCGEPIAYGYNRTGRNGWVWHKAIKQWRRVLTPQEAGVFDDHGTTNIEGQVCRHGRYAYNQQIYEYKTLSCDHDPSVDVGWTLNGSQRIKRFDPSTQKVGIIGYYLK